MAPVLLLLVPLALAMRTEHNEYQKGSAWMQKLPMKLHSAANRTTLPRIPNVWKDRFQVLRKLGEGGFGAVYQMKVTCADSWFSKAPETFVSAKLVIRQDGNLEKEVKMLKTHFSEYVVSTLGTPDTAKNFEGEWVMMPFLNGGSLKDLLSKCSDNDHCICRRHTCSCEGVDQPWSCWEAVPGLSLPYILALFDEVLAGLEAIHQQGLVHMDMKPDNIMLQCTGTGYNKKCFASVIDLGTLRRSNSTTPVIGTAGYIAPEAYLINGSGRHAGIPSNDVWAMGVTLFQLLYNDFPSYIGFWGPDIKELLKYQPENDRNIPKNRTDLDQLVVDMLNTNHTARTSLPEVRRRLRSIIEKRMTARHRWPEIANMIHETPTERGLSPAATLPQCINEPSFSELNSKEDLQPQGPQGMDLMVGAKAAPKAAKTKDDQPCRGKSWEAEGWFQCGVCNAIFCQRCCACLVMWEGQITEKFFREKSCEPV